MFAAHLSTRPEGVVWGVFTATHSFTQGDPVSLKIFNTLVDAVVRAWMEEVCNTKVTYHRIGYTMGDRDVFY